MWWSEDPIPGRGRVEWSEASVGVGVHGPEEIPFVGGYGWLEVSQGWEVL